MKSVETIPIFRIFDEAKAREFYVDFLGFAVDWEHRFGDDLPLYMQVSRGGVTLHLSEHYGDCAPGSKAIVKIEGLKALHAELSAKKHRYGRPGLNDWIGGGKVVSLTDPFHNKLDFVETA